MPGPKKDSDFSRGSARAQNGNRQSFRTDTAISNNRGLQERTLQRWQPDDNSTTDGGLESSGNTGRAWDQFATNEQLFGVKTDYDENMYTTSINRSHPLYRDRLAAADRTARDIEKSAPLTHHQAEERIMDFIGADKGGDEEEKYSGVRRNADFPALGSTPNTGKYTPPAKRAPSGQPGASGAPFDPAIISSQLRTSNGSAAKRPLKPDVASNSRATSQSPAPKAADAKTTSPKTDTTKADGPVTPSTAKNSPATKACVSKNSTEAGQEVLNKMKGFNKDGAKGTEFTKPEGPSTPAAPKSGPAAKALATPMTVGAPSKTNPENVGQEVYSKFKDFAHSERTNVEKARSTKLRQDKEEKLHELRKFATNFKLTTPVPNDLIGIIAKDPRKQQEIQKKALRNAADAKTKPAEKDEKSPISKEASSTTSTFTKPLVSNENSISTVGVDPKLAGFSRPVAPGGPGQAGANMNRVNRSSYQQFSHNNHGNFRGNQQATQSRASVSIHSKSSKMHQSPIPPPQPHGPGSQPPPPPGVDNRQPALPTGLKMNAAAPVFRPDAPSFSPAGFGKTPAPATAVAPAVAPSPRPTPSVTEPSAPIPVAIPVSAPSAALVRRKTNRVDPQKCDVYAYIKSLTPKAGKDVANNGGIVYAFDTGVLWRLPKPDEKDDSTMKLNIKSRFEKMPFVPPGVATPIPTNVMPQGHHGPGHMHMPPAPPGMGPRQSPHMPAMQMQPHQGMLNHVYDDRMMHSQSQQSYASPRMSQMQPFLNSPAQMHAMPFAGPPGSQFRGFPNNGQYMPQQSHMGGPMMPPMFNGPPHGGLNMYPSHVPFMPPGGPGVNGGGFSSPGRPQAPMMAPQGSQQGQHGFGMSPNMGYNSPVFVPAQHGPGNGRSGFGGPGMQHYGSSPQNMHQFGPGGHHMGHRSGSHNGYKPYQNHNNHGPGHNGPPQPHSQQQTPTPPTRTENATPITEEAK